MNVYYARLYDRTLGREMSPAAGAVQVPLSKDDDALEHQVVKVDGRRHLVIDGSGTWYVGKPPSALLARNDVDVRDSEQNPYPRSAADRLCTHPSRDAKPRASGRPLPGPGYMARLEEVGLWPTPKGEKLSRFKEAKLRKPAEAGRRLFEAQGMTGAALETAVARMASGARGRQVPNLDDLLEDDPPPAAAKPDPKAKKTA